MLTLLAIGNLTIKARGSEHRLPLNRVANDGESTMLQKTVVPEFFQESVRAFAGNSRTDL